VHFYKYNPAIPKKNWWVSLLCSAFLCPVHGQYDGSVRAGYFEWFQSQTQAKELYDKGSKLYIFNSGSPLFASPNPNARIVDRLRAGSPVVTLSYPEDNPGPMTYRGYQDFWYEVSFQNRAGEYKAGFLWGGNLAKGWSASDLDKDGSSELLLLGIHDNFEGMRAGKAALKLFQQGELKLFQSAAEHCISEACESNVLVRLIPDPIWPNMQILEVSTTQIGCDSGLSRHFYYWTGERFQKVYEFKWVQDRSERSVPFVLKPSGISRGQVQSYRCQYSYTNDDFSPVWRCAPESTEAPPSFFKKKPSRAR